MKIERIKKGEISSVQKFENQLGFELPRDYKEFLMENDGTKFKECSFYIKHIDQSILLDLLYGVTSEAPFNIYETNKEFADDIPPKSLIIGDDPGGAMILLICDGENDGVYFYDHQYFFEQSSDIGNTYWIADTFSDFMKMLTEID